jgi:tRNA A37 threonylcarbamoyladenosine modification protein TsaB
LVVTDARKNKAYVFDREIKGAVELDRVDELVKGRRVITDNSLFERINQNAEMAISYQAGSYQLGNILSELAIKHESTDWQKLKPLYIQPPPVFGK